MKPTNPHPKILREIPIPIAGIHDPYVLINETNRDAIVINRDLSRTAEPIKVTLKPRTWFKFPHMDYAVYSAAGEEKAPELTMLRGRNMDQFLKHSKPGLTEAKDETGDLQ